MNIWQKALEHHKRLDIVIGYMAQFHRDLIGVDYVNGWSILDKQEWLVKTGYTQSDLNKIERA